MIAEMFPNYRLNDPPSDALTHWIVILEYQEFEYIDNDGVLKKEGWFKVADSDAPYYVNNNVAQGQILWVKADHILEAFSYGTIIQSYNE